MKKVNVFIILLALTFLTVGFNLNLSELGGVTFTGNILGVDGKKIENVGVRIYVNGSYHSGRFIEDGECDFRLPRDGKVSIRFYHPEMASVQVDVDARLDGIAKKAEVIYDVRMINQNYAEQMASFDFKKEPIAVFKIEKQNVGFNVIGDKTLAVYKQLNDMLCAANEIRK